MGFSNLQNLAPVCKILQIMDEKVVSSVALPIDTNHRNSTPKQKLHFSSLLPPELGTFFAIRGHWENGPPCSFHTPDSTGQAMSATKMSIGLAEIFPPQAIVLGLKNRTKPGAIAELIRQLIELRHISEDDERGVVESILAQEKLGSTALYDGVAFPHCRSSCTDRFVGKSTG